MKFYDAITSGIAHLQQNRLRSGLSILGILIGVASVLCMIAIGDGTQKIIADDIEKLGGPNHVRFWVRPYTYPRGKPKKRTTERYSLADARAIEAECPDVLYVLPQNRKYPRWVTSNQGVQIRSTIEGVTADYAHIMGWEVQHGRFLSEDDFANAQQVCVLVVNAATELFRNTPPLGQEVKIRLRRRRWVRCRVVGIMAPRGESLSRGMSMDDIIFVPLITRQQHISSERYVERLIVFFQKGTNVYTVINSVKEVLRKRHRGVTDFIGYWRPTGKIRMLERIEEVIKIALGGIAGFSLFVSGISIMNMCLISAGEKTREIGLRKAVGAKRIDIFYQFLTESICLCLCGGVLGIVGGWLFAHGMARVAVRILPIVAEWPVVLSVQWVLISVIFCIFIGIIFGVYPAIRAAWMSPI